MIILKKIPFNENYVFTNKTDHWKPDNENNYTINVDLPHDITIAKKPSKDCIQDYATGYYVGDSGVYSKTFNLPKEYDNKRILIEIGGAYMLSMVEFNGDLICKNYNGYTTFTGDLTGKVRAENNYLRISTFNSSGLNSRWYTGSGLYRDVNILVGDLLHISHNGIAVSTKKLTDNNGTISVKAEIENNYQRGVAFSVRAIISDCNNVKIQERTVNCYLNKNSCDVADFTFDLKNITPWDLENPYLYKVTCQIIRENEVLDEDFANFGVRTIELKPEVGFLLNGKAIKLKGGCVHSDNGILGAVSYPEAEYRKVKLHKDNGFNALRCAHNVPSAEFLDACDRYGVLVINEVFDVWNLPKTDNDYSQFFESNWEKDLSSMIKRDRNHPSVIVWGLGNEITEQGGRSGGYLWAKKLADYARNIDDTRFISIAISGVPPYFSDLEYGEFIRNVQNHTPADGEKVWEKGYVRPFSLEVDEKKKERFNALTEEFAQPLDLFGYNYCINFYDKEKYPQRMAYCSETFPICDDMLWDYVNENDNIIGMFSWSSMQYLGESFLGKIGYCNEGEKLPIWPQYPDRVAVAGDFDLCGHRTPQGYLKSIFWGSKETYIAVRPPKNNGKVEILGAWSWPEESDCWTFEGYEGENVVIEVFSASKKVKLFLDDRLIGEEKAGKENRYRAWFEIPYKKGKLTAISYDGKKEVSRYEIRTAEKPCSIRITKEESCSKTGEIVFLHCDYVDKNGTVVPSAEILTKAVVSGGELLAFGNSCPSTEEVYTSGEFTSYKGRLTAVVKPTTKKEVTVTVTALSGDKLSATFCMEASAGNRNLG